MCPFRVRGGGNQQSGSGAFRVTSDLGVRQRSAAAATGQAGDPVDMATAPLQPAKLIFREFWRSFADILLL